MKTMENSLREEIQQLKKIVAEARKRLKTAPEGKLRINKKRGDVEYYYKSANRSNRSNDNGRYLKKSERKLAKEIAQRDYDVHVMKNAQEDYYRKRRAGTFEVREDYSG